MKAKSQISDSQTRLTSSPLRHLFTLMVLILLGGGVKTGRAWIACPANATSSGAPATSPFCTARPNSCTRAHALSLAAGLQSGMYRVRWEIKDLARYGMPQLLRNEQPTLLAAALFTAILLWVILKPARGGNPLRPKQELAVEFAPVIQFNPPLKFRRPSLNDLNRPAYARELKARSFPAR